MASEHPGGRVMPVAVADQPVVQVGTADIRHPVQEALQRHVGLGSGQRGPGTGVDAVAEGDVLAAVLPVENQELVGFVELRTDPGWRRWAGS